MENQGYAQLSLKKGVAALALSVLLLGGLAHADKQLQSAEEPLEIKLNQALNTETAHYGDPFEGTLTETYRLDNRELPAGTIVKGQVHSGHASMILGMPGYVALDIQEADLPSGEICHFSGDGLTTQKYHNPKAHTAKATLMTGIPFSAISAVDALPLKLAAGLSFWQIAPISLAARMALGVGMEMHDRHKAVPQSPAASYPVQTQVGYGMLRGTGLTGAYRMITTGPEPNLKEGAVIAVHLPKKDMNKLFEAGSAVQTVQADPTPDVPVSAGDLKPVDRDAQGFESVHGTIPGSVETQSIPPAAAQQPGSQNNPQ